MPGQAVVVRSTAGTRRRRWVLAPVLLLVAGACQAGAPFESWLERRDKGVIRQQFDYSCGLAALATILTHHYADPVDELELLQALTIAAGTDGAGAGDRRVGVSFADLAALAGLRGYLARGLSLPLADLARLRQPVIVALSVNRRAHFSVLERVDARGVFHLADPSWGNRRLSAAEFRRYFSAVTEPANG